MAKAHFQRVLGNDIKRLEHQLRGLCKGQLQASEAERLKVLDLACGECFEAEMLQRVLRESAQPAGAIDTEMKVDFVGMDIREAEIASAADRCRNVQDPVDFKFFAGDGKKLLQDSALPETFDVVFVRHQNYYLGGKEWHDLFQRSLEKLSPNGKLIITSYFDHEHELAKEAIQNVGGQLIEDVANQEARALRTAGKHVDKRLALFQRQD